MVQFATLEFYAVCILFLKGLLMKKTVIILLLTALPLLSFAANVEERVALEYFQEHCAKEKDPVKRQNYCHMLDSRNSSRILLSFQQENIGHA